MSTDCTFKFDHPNRIYNSGDTLNGTVELKIKKNSISIRGISIKIFGFEKVFWNDSSGRKTIHFKSYEEYLNSVTYVLGSADGDSFDLKPGTYDYTFTSELPKLLPNTIKEKYCKVKYKVIVTIEIEERFRFDKVFKKDFIINHISDLNLTTINLQPRKYMSDIKFSPSIFRFCCNDNGEIKAELEIYSDGYLPGEIIPFKLTVHNDSNYNLYDIDMKLIICYKLKFIEPYVNETEINKDLLIKIFLNNISKYTTKEFEDNFILPYLLPTHNSKFIQVKYKIIAKISDGCIRNFYIEMPITIGSIRMTNFDLKERKNSDDASWSLGSLYSTSSFGCVPSLPSFPSLPSLFSLDDD